MCVFRLNKVGLLYQMQKNIFLILQCTLWSSCVIRLSCQKAVKPVLWSKQGKLTFFPDICKVQVLQFTETTSLFQQRWSSVFPGEMEKMWTIYSSYKLMTPYPHPIYKTYYS